MCPISNNIVGGDDMGNPTMYDRVVEQSLPLIEAYHNDLLVHDKKFFGENPDIAFLHFTGKTGTHVFGFHPSGAYPPAHKVVPYLFGHADRWQILEGELRTVEAMRRHGRDRLVLYGNDIGRLDTVSLEDGVSLFAAYVDKMRRFWTQEEEGERYGRNA